jgi:O-antigen/teichoic acid export membrane protein
MEASFQKRYLFKLLTNAVSFGVSLITQSIVPRTLGPAAYGNFSFLTNFFWQVIGFLNLNSSTAFYTKLSQRQQDKGLISFYFYLTFLIGAVMTALVASCYILGVEQWVWPDQGVVFVVMAAFYSFLKFYNDSLIQVSDAYGLTTKSEILNMIQKVVGLLIIAFLFWCGWLTLFNYFAFQLFLLAGAIAALCWLIGRYHSPLITCWKLNRIQLKSYSREFSAFCLPLVVFSFFAILEQILDRWLLQKFSGSIEQGFYSLAYQTGAICFLFVSAMVPLVMREYAVSFAARDTEKMAVLFTRYSKMLFAVAAFFGCFLAAEAKNVMLIFGGAAFTGAILPIAIMCFYPIHQTYGQMNAAFFLPPRGQKPIAASA